MKKGAKRFNQILPEGFKRRVVYSRRVAKVRKGDKLLSFSVLVVVGNEKGRVGVAVAKARDTRLAIDKATQLAYKKTIKVPMTKGTVPHDVTVKFKAAKVLIKPAPQGSGIIAGSSVKVVLELAGIHNVVAKQIGKGSLINNAYCTIKALKQLQYTKRNKLSNANRSGNSK